MTEKNRIYTPAFWKLCVSGFLFFASFNMIIPELPDYLTSLGGAEYKGLIIALFTLTAALSRPFSGKLTDTIGRRPVMIFGALICGVSGLFYPVLTSVIGFFGLRMLHGLSTGFKPTAISAYLADVIPFNKRGEAMGIFGTFSSAGMAFGPAVGSPLASWLGMDMMFYSSSLLSVLAALLVWNMPETMEEPAKFKWNQLKIKWKDTFDFKVWPPSLLMILSAFSFGLVLTIIPDYSVYLGIENKGLFFSVFTLSSIAVRLLAGKASDKFGRLPVLLFSTSIIMVSMVLLAYFPSPTWMMISGVLYGLGIGINSPTLFAYTVDLGNKAFRGRGMSTMYVALEIGIGSGAFFAGIIYANQVENFAATFISAAGLALAALILVAIWIMQKRENRTSLN